jgi:type I restriction enzyme S subunit
LEGQSNELSTELTHQLTLVKKLRQQLLQDAVQGKLVEQNPTDEPASELLKKIKAEKEKLIAEKKLKKEKELPSINPEEIPFEIPGNWVWCRFENLCSHIFDMEHKMPNAISNGGVMFLSAKDLIDKGKINYIDNVKHISEEDYNYLTRNFKPQRNDIIYSRRGANLGKSRIVDTDLKYLASYSCCTIRTLNPCLEYINYLLDGGFILQQAVKHTTNNSIPDLGVNKIKSFIVPLPPLSEQKRIVNKIDELIQYCNELEANIKQSESQNEKLLQQVLREALRKEPVGV